MNANTLNITDREVIQSVSFIFKYEMPEDIELDPEFLKNQIAEQSKYQFLQFFKSNYDLYYDDDLKNILPKTKTYYYLYISFESTRQKVTVDKKTKKVISPKYYEYTKLQPNFFQPRVVDRKPHKDNRKSVLYFLLRSVEANKSVSLYFSQNEVKTLATNNLEYHFWKIQNLNSAEHFQSYVEDNNLYYYLDVLISKFESLNLFNNSISLNSGYITKTVPSFIKQFFKQPLIKQEVNNNIQEEIPLKMLESPSKDFLQIPHDYEDVLEGCDSLISELLEKEDYQSQEHLSYKVFNSLNVKNSKSLSNILRNLYLKDSAKANNTNSPSITKSGGLKFLYYQKKFITNPYRSGSTNLFLQTIFKYLSFDYQEIYKKYTKK